MIHLVNMNKMTGQGDSFKRYHITCAWTGTYNDSGQDTIHDPCLVSVSFSLEQSAEKTRRL